MKRIKVLIADDHPVVRQGLKASLEDYKGIQIVGEASDGAEALKKTRRLSPNVVLMDISMPNLNGLDATRKLSKLHPKVKVVILSMHQYKAYILETIHSGAKGYVLKDSPPSEIVRAIETVWAGKPYFSPRVSQVVVNEYVQKPKSAGKPGARPDISPREAEVLSLIAKGLSNKEIAGQLFLSVRTVETHREHIMKKLDTHGAAGLTRYAIARGLISVKETPQERELIGDPDK